MKIALGSDHRGDMVTSDLLLYLKTQGHEPFTFGSYDGESCDYPDEAWHVAKAVSKGDADRGILACGSGIGMSIAANKVHGIRAALVFDEIAAGRSRRHNDANVLCLSPEMTPPGPDPQNRGCLAERGIRGRQARPSHRQDHRDRTGG